MKNFTYDIERSSAPYILSAVIGADSFFYGLFDADYNLYACKYYDDVDYDEAFTKVIAEEMKPYSGVRQVVSFSTKPFLHMGSDDETVVKYYPAYDDKQLAVEKFTTQEIRVLYGLDSQHLKFLEDCFDRPSYHHISTVLNHAFYPNTKKQLILHVDNGIAHLTYANQERMIYYNQFKCDDKKDYLYFTMMAYELLKLDPENVPLVISGRLEKSSEIYDLLYDYIRNIEFVNSRHLGVEDVRFRQSKHIYNDLYSTAICG